MASDFPSRYMVFDVESIGLHGEGFAVGWVVIDEAGTEIGAGMFACYPSEAMGAASDRAWVAANCPTLPVNCSTVYEVRAAFWQAWLKEKDLGAALVADCAWPVEARFLAACVDQAPNGRRWEGPYPLHDVASARLAAGLDPLATVERLPSEEPKHNPLMDARQSARLWLEAIHGQ